MSNYSDKVKNERVAGRRSFYQHTRDKELIELYLGIREEIYERIERGRLEAPDGFEAELMLIAAQRAQS